MTAKQAHSRWQWMKVPAFFIAATAVTVGLLVGGLVWHKLQNLRVQTVSARLTSAGDVIWGDRRISVDAIESELQQTAGLLQSHGFKPRLLIEHYSDTRKSDIVALTRIGHDAGFVIVDTKAHSWTSPPPRQDNEGELRPRNNGMHGSGVVSGAAIAMSLVAAP